MESQDGGVTAASLQAADVLLADACCVRSLLLCQPLRQPEPSEIESDLKAHVHGAPLPQQGVEIYQL
ncbi:hypothetical protein ATE72_05925 [Sphingopyxis sp. HXXIV]|nr:hypothetical protein ATE72_05925 [Sphingopyxis sp. HXXIV]